MDPVIFLEKVRRPVLRGLVRERLDRRAAPVTGVAAEPVSLALVIGPPGSGKTTLLKAINGLVTPDAGAVRVQPGGDVERQRGPLLPGGRDVAEELAERSPWAFTGLRRPVGGGGLQVSPASPVTVSSFGSVTMAAPVLPGAGAVEVQITGKLVGVGVAQR